MSRAATLALTGALAAALAVSACSREAPADDPAATPAAPGAPATAATAGAVPSGTSLAGEVSGLSGEISAFRVEETATQTIVELAADVLFAFDRADLAPTAAEQLTRAAGLIRSGGAGPVAVVGHTDAKGDDAYNLDLSKRRAEAVAAWLSGPGGIEAARLRPEGRGEAEPAAPNQTASGADDPRGRALNRRVTVVIPKA